MASLIRGTPATTAGGKANNKVTDVAKQCPGDVFAMTCSDMKFLSFDPKTSTGKSWVPILKEDLKVTCKIIKTAKNGEIEKRDIEVVYLAAPKTKSLCMINPDVKAAEFPSGPTGQGSLNMASLIRGTPATTAGGKPNTKVTDVAKQCPGDVFAMTCSDKRYLSFDSKTSTGKSWVPYLKEDLKVTCNITKTA